MSSDSSNSTSPNLTPPSLANEPDLVDVSMDNETETVAPEVSDAIPKPRRLTPSEIEQYKINIVAKRKATMLRSKLFLTLDDLQRSDSQDPDTQPPLFFFHIQQLLLLPIQRSDISFLPRWCRLLRPGRLSQTVVVMLNNVGKTDYENHISEFKNLSSLMQGENQFMVEVAASEQYGLKPGYELFSVPLSHTSERRRSNPANGDVIAKSSANFDSVLKEAEVISRTDLLLSPAQLIFEGYPIPSAVAGFAHYVRTKSDYVEVTRESPLFAIDCEMCKTISNRLELTRITIVNESRQIVYDSFVKPKNQITDYLTKFSGITAKMLRKENTRLKDVQKTVADILPSDAILVGHSLCNDMHALQMCHPYIIDTSVIYNLRGLREHKPSLKNLSYTFLGRIIQAYEKHGHCSAEDALATLDLTLLKLRRGVEFGDLLLSIPVPGISLFCPAKHQNEFFNRRNNETAFFLQPWSKYRSLFKIAGEYQKSVTFIDSLESIQSHRSLIDSSYEMVDIISADGDKDAAKKAKEILDSNLKSPENVDLRPPRNVDFLWLQLHRFADCNDDTKSENSTSILRSFDRTIKKIHKRLKNNSLFLVILPGRFDRNALVFACLRHC